MTTAALRAEVESYHAKRRGEPYGLTAEDEQRLTAVLRTLDLRDEQEDRGLEREELAGASPAERLAAHRAAVRNTPVAFRIAASVHECAHAVVDRATGCDVEGISIYASGSPPQITGGKCMTRGRLSAAGAVAGAVGARMAGYPNSGAASDGDENAYRAAVGEAAADPSVRVRAEQEAAHILRANWQLVDLLAQRLLGSGSIEGAELEQLLAYTVVAG